MRKLTLVVTLFTLFLMVKSAHAQQFDVAFGLSAVKSTPAANATGNYFPQAVGGGAFPVFSADFLIKDHFGVQGEAAFRASQNLYAGSQPFRPIFYDFNGIYAPKFGRIEPEVMAGIGAESVRFYQPFFNCSFTGCTNYTSSNHFMGHVGGGIRLYIFGHVFVRPEAHVYLIHNNFQFSSGTAERFGVSLGYTLGGE